MVVQALGPLQAWAEHDRVTVRVSAEINAVPALILTICDDSRCGGAGAMAPPHRQPGPAIVVVADGPWVGLLCAAVVCGLQTETWIEGQAGTTIDWPT